MTVVGRKAKAGVSYAKFGCTAHYSRGAAICPNALSISEKKASRTLVGALKSKFDQPELLERFVSSFRDRVATLRAENAPGPDDADRRVRESERRIANVTESLAKVGWSDALAEKLREEETQLGRLKSERTAAAKRGAPRVLPHPRAIEGYLKTSFRSSRPTPSAVAKSSRGSSPRS
jgi:hypothetical protein